MTSTRQHAALENLVTRDNILVIGETPVTELSHAVGNRPFYVYDMHAISERISLLRNIFQDGIKIHYAVKANPHDEILSLMRTLADGIDVSSGGEIDSALKSGIPASTIGFSGPGKSFEELEKAVAAGITIHLESFAELERVTEAGNSTGAQPVVAIRINPDFELKSSGMKMSGGSKPFGVDQEMVPSMIKQVKSHGLSIKGFHVFTGSQNLHAENIIQSQDKIIDMLLELSNILGDIPDLLNIGGGFGIPYFESEQPLNINAIASFLNMKLMELRTKRSDACITLELGRYLVGEAGYYVTQVIERKSSRGKNFIITNGGMNHNLAASGNLGQVIRRNYPISVGNNIVSEELETVSISGPLCTPLDIIAESVRLPKMKEGDLVVVHQSGAYGLTASPVNFISHPAPSELTVK